MTIMIIFLAVILLIKYNPAIEYLEEEEMLVMWYNANGKYGDKQREYIVIWKE